MPGGQLSMMCEGILHPYTTLLYHNPKFIPKIVAKISTIFVNALVERLPRKNIHEWGSWKVKASFAFIILQSCSVIEFYTLSTSLLVVCYFSWSLAMDSSFFSSSVWYILNMNSWHSHYLKAFVMMFPISLVASSFSLQKPTKFCSSRSSLYILIVSISFFSDNFIFSFIITYLWIILKMCPYNIAKCRVRQLYHCLCVCVCLYVSEGVSDPTYWFEDISVP